MNPFPKSKVGRFQKLSPKKFPKIHRTKKDKSNKEEKKIKKLIRLKINIANNGKDYLNRQGDNFNIFTSSLQKIS